MYIVVQKSRSCMSNYLHNSNIHYATSRCGQNPSVLAVCIRLTSAWLPILAMDLESDVMSGVYYFRRRAKTDLETRVAFSLLDSLTSDLGLHSL